MLSQKLASLPFGKRESSQIHLSLMRANRKGSASMESEVDVLIVSRRIENKRALLRTLEGLPVNTFSASTIFQALEFLATHTLAVIFCEERLPDGSYRELLTSLPSSPQMNRFIVVQCTGEWEEYLEALRLGAAEVLRAPLQSTDIDIALFDAMRQGREHQAMAAEA
jgi:DNA-binding NtrC family response regulator